MAYMTAFCFSGHRNDFVNENHVSVCTVTDLYLMMGREFDQVEEVPAGNILGK